MMNSLTRIPSWIALHWKSGALCAGFVGIAATCRWYLETDEVRDQRAQRRNEKALRALADKISAYGRNVHQRYPTGDVVICERDLAEQLRKPRFCCHSTRPSFGQTKSPKGSPKRVLEAQRLISSLRRLGFTIRFTSVCGARRRIPAEPS